MRRIALIGTVVALAAMLAACGGTSTLDDTEAVVFLTVEIEEYNPDIDICTQLATGFDIAISKMNIVSQAKSPDTVLSAAQDVSLTRWVVTPYRTDGGTRASPEWSHDLTVYVAAEGEANLENYRVYPVELLRAPPLTSLLPENGGYDPETGRRNIRQSLELQIFGRTVSGKAVATEKIPIAFNFFCETP